MDCLHSDKHFDQENRLLLDLQENRLLLDLQKNKLVV